MPQSPKIASYVIVSPVKNEERYVEKTLRSVVAQTLRPYRWIIVDDGSSDKTPEILDRFARQFDWIQVLRLENNQSRQPGAGVVRAFAAGFDLVHAEAVDYVVKLDCDVELPASYFENLAARFSADPALGIASGAYLEVDQDRWNPVVMPHYHAAGASKMMRTACFREIGGFIESRGWDTVDEIRAQVLGWKTQHFGDLQFYHWKKEGSGIGSLATSAMHGQVYYLTGGGMLFLLLKVLHRMLFDKPFIGSGLALLGGFLKAMFCGDRKLVTSKEARFYARLLNRRMWGSVTAFWSPSPEGRTWSYD
jgi:poly-beta-1,6-N-acetyl-D-glucosamine synthase